MSHWNHQIDGQLVSGHFIKFDQPDLTNITLESLHTNIVNTCRYNGGLEWMLSKHLALCGLLVRLYAVHSALLQAGYGCSHDLHEAITGDMVSGLKKYCPGFTALEDAWENHTHTCIGLPLNHRNDKLIKFVDRRALVIEMTMLGHPAAERTAHNYGGPMTTEEQALFERVSSMSAEDAWDKIVRDIETAKEVLNERNRYSGARRNNQSN